MALYYGVKQASKIEWMKERAKYVSKQNCNKMCTFVWDDAYTQTRRIVYVCVGPMFVGLYLSINIININCKKFNSFSVIKSNTHTYT